MIKATLFNMGFHILDTDCSIRLSAPAASSQMTILAYLIILAIFDCLVTLQTEFFLIGTGIPKALWAVVPSLEQSAAIPVLVTTIPPELGIE